MYDYRENVVLYIYIYIKNKKTTVDNQYLYL